MNGWKGSSPRMRGALSVVTEPREQPGIIPAYAGSTEAEALASILGWDHPRVCGEHTLRSKLNGETEGSSPRMRGAPARGRFLYCMTGIIPAYAGST